MTISGALIVGVPCDKVIASTSTLEICAGQGSVLLSVQFNNKYKRVTCIVEYLVIFNIPMKDVVYTPYSARINFIKDEKPLEFLENPIASFS